MTASCASLKKEMDAYAEEQRCDDEKRDERITKLDEWINGNGKEGAKVTLATILLRLDTVEKKLDSMTKAVWGLVATIGGGIVLWFLTVQLPKLVAHP